ncbi:unnamed protein product [Brassica oleracea]
MTYKPGRKEFPMWDIISLIPLLEMIALIAQKSRNFRTDIISLLHHYYHSSSRCCFSIRAQNADNGADSDRRYDFDLFTPSAPVAAATSYGTSAAVCELPFSTISSDTAGGVGGT